MVKYIVKKKRVIVRDISSIPLEEWKSVMKRVIGRYYTDLQGEGPAWTFSIVHLDTFQSELNKRVVGQEEMTTSQSVINTHDNPIAMVAPLSPSSQSSAISIDIIQDNKENDDASHPHVYQYNIDDSILDFVRNWVQDTNLSYLMMV